MVFEQIEQLRRKYTDKWVVVDDSQPELRRFRGATGIVKTVNMSGRALVEFDLYENIGWFDIDPDFLKVVERPADQVEPTAEKAAAKPAAAKPVPTKAPIAKKAPAQATAPQDGPTRPGAGMSVADILAAARGDAAGTSAAEPAAASTTSRPAAAQEKKEPADAGSMSVADILAAARGEAAAGTGPTQEQSAPSASEETKAQGTSPPTASAPASETESEQTAATTTDTSSEELPTDVAGIVEWCRRHDG